MKRLALSLRDQLMARLVAEEVAKAIDAMLTARDERQRAADAAREKVNAVALDQARYRPEQ